MLKVVVNLCAIKKNLSYIKSVCRSKICAVVKANAYGHGLVKVAKQVKNEVDFFAVATVKEAITLYKNGIENNILVLSENDFTNAIPRSIIPSISNAQDIIKLSKIAKTIAIKVNTGMNRLGCSPNEVKDFVKVALKNNLSIDSIYSHLYNPSDIVLSSEQLSRLTGAIKDVNLPFKAHISASSCLYLPQSFHLDAVRVGLALYGYSNTNLNPAMRIFSKILVINEVKRNEKIGYGNFVACCDMTIATVRLGYGDGVRRNGQLCFFVNGIRCYTIGAICMDTCMINVSGVACEIGDTVELDMGWLIKNYGICEYEAVTLLNERAEREYVYE